MKKLIKNIFRVLFSLLLIFSVFSIVNVVAEEAIFQITNISVKEKSDKVTVNDVSISGGELNNDIEFTDLNDYIKYDITIKNVSNDTYTIKSISDNNNSDYLEYTYDDLSNVKLNSSEEKTFELQIKYVQETDDFTITDKAVSLTLTYEREDGTTGSEVITNNSNDSTNSSNKISNPNTGDNITIYIILGIISLIGLTVTTVNRKYLNKSLMSIAVFSMIAIPFGVKADSDKCIIKINNLINTPYGEIIFNSLNGKFSDNSTTSVFRYKHIDPPSEVKISHTENVDDTGLQTGLYDNNWDSSNIVGTDRGDTSKNHVVTIDGASSLVVDIYYNGEDTDYDWACVWEGNHPDYSCFNDYDEKYGGVQTGTFEVNTNTLTNMGHETINIDGDSVTFGFVSDSYGCEYGYGYYAIVRADTGMKKSVEYEEPTLSGKKFAGWYTDADCTDGNEFTVNYNSYDKVTVYAKYVVPPPYTVLSGDLNTSGSIIDIGGERFTLIKNYGDTVTLLAMHPLNVGPNQKDDDRKGIQDGSLNWFANNSDGKLKFADNTYWLEDGQFKSEYNESRYIYDENSNLYQYVEDYVSYLKQLYSGVVSGRIWSPEEDEIFNCSCAERMCFNSSLYIGASNRFWTGKGWNSSGNVVYSGNGYFYTMYNEELFLVPIIEMNI